MARPIRIEYPGAVYHVTARGNERRLTFRDDDDRRGFLAALAEAVAEHGLRLHGYCLMPNHYHLLLETPRGNLSRAMAWLQTTYTVRFNRRHKRSGHLFQGRFKAHLVEADGYAMTLLRYVHLNPVRPREKTADVPSESRGPFETYPWSSHRAYLGASFAPSWLCTEWLSFFAPTRKEASRRYGRFVADAFGKEIENPWEHLRLGLVLGSEALTDKVRDLLRGRQPQGEVHWVSQAESREARENAEKLLAGDAHDRRIQVWIRVRLGNERRIDVARELGYKDGSAVTQILKRLEVAVQSDPALAKRLATLAREHARTMSGVNVKR